MKKLSFLIVALLLVGCSPYAESESAEKQVYTASIDDAISRVYIAEDLSLHFNSSDAINLFSTTASAKYIFTGKQGDTSGEFIREGAQGTSGSSLGKTYAIYPYNRDAKINSDGVMSSELATTQDYVENSVSRGANVMAAVTSSKKDKHLSFSNVCSYVCVEFYGKEVLLRSLKLKSNGGEKIAGAMTVAPSDRVFVATAAQDASDVITLNLGGGVLLSESATEPTKFYFATLPTTLATGFTLTAMDNSGNNFTVKVDSKVELERSALYTVEAKEIAFVATEIKGLTAPESVALPAQSKSCQTISVGATGEDITVSTSEPWFGVVESDKSVKAGSAKSVRIWAEPNFSAAERTATIIVKGAKSGVSVSIPVTQPAYFTTINEAFPARLELQSSTSDTSKWVSNGVVKPKNSDAVLCAVSTSGNTHKYEISSGARISNLGVGDYLLYAIPTKGVAAGEQIDFMCSIGPASGAPKYYIFEYWDDGEWKSVESSLRTAEEDPNIKYSFICTVMDESYIVTYTQSFALSKAVTNGCVMVRVRVLTPGTGAIRIPSGTGYMGMYMINYPNAVPVTDSKKMAFLGNSFTYYFGTAFMFKEIARTEGHQVDAFIGVKGSQMFSDHVRLYMSQEVLKQGNFDYAFLQDAATNLAEYADKGTKSILDASNKLNTQTLTYSPSCQIVYERTWASSTDNYRGYGSYDKLDYLIKTGAEKLVADVDHKGIIISPIGLGFRVAREQNVNLIHTDNKHQSREGAYMKACINYLFVYKTRFTSNVSNCGVDPTVAKSIRDIAERVVFDGVDENYNFE